MTEKMMSQLAEEYTKNVVSSFKIVAAKAYTDGLKDAIKFYKDKDCKVYPEDVLEFIEYYGG